MNRLYIFILVISTYFLYIVIVMMFINRLGFVTKVGQKTTQTIDNIWNKQQYEACKKYNSRPVAIFVDINIANPNRNVSNNKYKQGFSQEDKNQKKFKIIKYFAKMFPEGHLFVIIRALSVSKPPLEHTTFSIFIVASNEHY